MTIIKYRKKVKMITEDLHKWTLLNYQAFHASCTVVLDVEQIVTRLWKHS